MIMEREKPSTWEKIIKDANSAVKKQRADDILLYFRSIDFSVGFVRRKNASRCSQKEDKVWEYGLLYPIRIL